MKRILLIPALLIISSLGLARIATTEYDLAPTDCEGAPVSLSEYVTIEAYIDTQPIPVQATDPCQVGPTGTAVDVPPAGATVVEGTFGTNTVSFDLASGDYWIRMRVQDDNGDWSNFSNQLTITVPPGIKRAPILIRIAI